MLLGRLGHSGTESSRQEPNETLCDGLGAWYQAHHVVVQINREEIMAKACYSSDPLTSATPNMKEFKVSSQIEFVSVQPDQPKLPTVRDMKVGETFMRHGAVCMAVRICHVMPCADSNVDIQPTARNGNVAIINLQTGAVWIPEQHEEVLPVKVSAQVTKK